MKLHPHDLDKISALTLEHYERRAEDFREGTRDHDVSQNVAALLAHMESEPPFTILDIHFTGSTTGIFKLSSLNNNL